MLTILLIGITNLPLIANAQIGNYTCIGEWGSFGTGLGQLEYPQCICVDSSTGNVYVTDTGNNRIVEYNNDGSRMLNEFGSYGTRIGHFNNPWGNAVDSSGNIYIADQSNNRIQQFSRDGNFIKNWDFANMSDGAIQLIDPIGVAIDSSDNIYVLGFASTNWHGIINKYDRNSTYLTQWEGGGIGGDSSDWLNTPMGIATDHLGYVYVSNTEGNCINKYTNNGVIVSHFGNNTDNTEQLNFPKGLAVDSNNNIFVADSYNNCIKEFDNNGNYVTQLGSFGHEKGQFNYPSGIAIDASNKIYVLDTSNSRVEVFALPQPILPTVNFTANTTQGTAPLWVQFNDYSTNATHISFDFGDNTGGSDQVGSHIGHEFMSPGLYNVNWTAYNDNGSSSTYTLINATSLPITPVIKTPVAKFVANTTVGDNTLTVAFTDMSKNKPTNWSWNFGDKTPVVKTQNATHTYTKTGSFTVSLTVKNTAGSNTMTVYNYITVNLIKPPKASFAFAPKTGKVPLTVAFVDQSTNNPTSWSWNFGNGNTSNVQYPPIQKYTQKGVFSVSLTVANKGGSSAVIKSVTAK